MQTAGVLGMQPRRSYFNITGEADGWLSHAADPTLQGVLLDLELTVFKTKVRALKSFSPVSHQKWNCHHGFTIPITTPSQSLVPFLCSYCAQLSSLVPATVPSWDVAQR